MLTGLLAFQLLSSPAHAAEHRLGLSGTLDRSSGLVTQIPRMGAHLGATYVLGGEKNGFQAELSFQQYTAYGIWERFPALSLSWAHAWGEQEVHGYHALGAGVALTGLMPDALSPALPMIRLEGGVEMERERLWFRGGLAAFAVVPGPALGAGPRVVVGANF